MSINEQATVEPGAKHIGLAIGAGLGAALAGAVAWAIVTVVSNYELGVMAIAVGFLVGKAIVTVAPSRDATFGFVGAGCSLLGCLLGNLLSAVGFLAQASHIGYFEALGHLDMDMAVKLMTVTFSPMDLIFYAIGIYEGYRFSFVK
jgi:hypothetical protein